MLWDLAEGKRLYSLDAGEIINALCFSPNRYWLCAATSQCIKARAHAALVFTHHFYYVLPCALCREQV